MPSREPLPFLSQGITHWRLLLNCSRPSPTPDLISPLLDLRRRDAQLTRKRSPLPYQLGICRQWPLQQHLGFHIMTVRKGP